MCKHCGAFGELLNQYLHTLICVHGCYAEQEACDDARLRCTRSDVSDYLLEVTQSLTKLICAQTLDYVGVTFSSEAGGVERGARFLAEVGLHVEIVSGLSGEDLPRTAPPLLSSGPGESPGDAGRVGHQQHTAPLGKVAPAKAVALLRRVRCLETKTRPSESAAGGRGLPASGEPAPTFRIRIGVRGDPFLSPQGGGLAASKQTTVPPAQQAALKQLNTRWVSAAEHHGPHRGAEMLHSSCLSVGGGAGARNAENHLGAAQGEKGGGEVFCTLVRWRNAAEES